MVSSRRGFNPIAFTPWPVTILSSLVYLALIIPIIVVHHLVPPAPKESPAGVDLEEAWHDLQHLTRQYHPYNSHSNDEVHQWLLKRIHAISATSARSESQPGPEVFVFDDNQTNLTFSSVGVAVTSITGVYFESRNIVVYIRGTEDEPGDWWKSPDGEPSGKGGVLVNAHYDSVSTGYGATDNGVGVITTLQLLKYFTTPGHYPRKGLVLLFNNGEEDFLNGAYAYSQHPMSKFTHTFLNLEGAGAGGRAVLFRSTDTEVTRFYGKSEHPFGTVLARDAFKLKFIRSETDYHVFDGVFGMRGLDVAFMEPRSRYHTDQDDARHTSIDSVWHMLSAAITTTEGLVSYTGDAFDSDSGDGGKLNNGIGTLGVWFDFFGSSFAVFQLNTLFGHSVALLVVAPLLLIITSVALFAVDKMYMFSMYTYISESGGQVSLYGLRGMFRFPLILGISTALTIALAFLIMKVNPFIIYSSPYAVWSMMLSTCMFFAWFISCVADFARPSALHRAYAFSWMFGIMWVFLVIATVYQKQHGIASSYFIVFYFAGVAVATWISYLELFGLPKTQDYARRQGRLSDRTPSSDSHFLAPSADELPSSSSAAGRDFNPEDVEDEEPTESTSLLRGQQRTTFANYASARGSQESNISNQGSSSLHPKDHRLEQKWSIYLMSSAWILQFLLVAPIVIILLGQLGLFLTSATYQIGADGGSQLVIYIGIAVLSVLILLPLFPFIHRFTYHIPTFLLFILIGTLVYNLTAFPFSHSNRLKLAFVQEMDLATGNNQASLVGVEPYIHNVVRAIPSVQDEKISCTSHGYGGRTKCSWPGLKPKVAEGPYKDWVTYNISQTKDDKITRFEVSGKNTRACKLLFDSPIADFHVQGSVIDKRIPHTGPKGVSEIRLWSRNWENTWTVDVEWAKKNSERTGKVMCLWSDDNDAHVIPELDLVRKFAPWWVAITKLRDGLVEGSYSFKL
ncbi:vacuolar membrane protease [Trichophyton mentagrophytes]|nr:vacuolar membrane protease [Trichophyton mentagrophytes]